MCFILTELNTSRFSQGNYRDVLLPYALGNKNHNDLRHIGGGFRVSKELDVEL